MEREKQEIMQEIRATLADLRKELDSSIGAIGELMLVDSLDALLDEYEGKPIAIAVSFENGKNDWRREYFSSREKAAEFIEKLRELRGNDVQYYTDVTKFWEGKDVDSLW